MNRTRVGIIGWGTVGTGTARILLDDKELIEQKLGWPLELAKIADLDLTTDRGYEIDSSLLTTSADEILEDPDIDIVVELVGGYEPARSFILKAIANGKHVVTANKALLATYGKEIFEAAAKAKVEVLYEASVGGGIPVIRSMKEGLAANHIHYFFGILNGTSNYILTKMSNEGVDFATALKEAQEIGYAEADPTFDVEGIDAAHKLVILTALAYGLRVEMDDVFVEGISKLEPLDITFADEFGYVIKLLAISAQKGEEVEARLHPHHAAQRPFAGRSRRPVQRGAHPWRLRGGHPVVRSGRGYDGHGQRRCRRSDGIGPQPPQRVHPARAGSGLENVQG